MRNIFTLFVFILTSIGLYAQNHGPMKFSGPSNFSNSVMGVSVDNEADTIIFTMNSMTSGDITIPTLYYTAMNMTIPSFTIANATFAFDMSTMTATFEAADYDVTIDVNGTEKHITGQLKEAEYCGSNGHIFKLECTIKYGNMPLILTYTINATYVSSPASINHLGGAETSEPIYDITGKQVAHPIHGQIYMQGGKKFILR